MSVSTKDIFPAQVTWEFTMQMRRKTSQEAQLKDLLLRTHSFLPSFKTQIFEGSSINLRPKGYILFGHLDMGEGEASQAEGPVAPKAVGRGPIRSEYTKRNREELG